MNMAFADLMLEGYSLPFYLNHVGVHYQLWTKSTFFIICPLTYSSSAWILFFNSLCYLQPLYPAKDLAQFIFRLSTEHCQHGIITSASPYCGRSTSCSLQE